MISFLKETLPTSARSSLSRGFRRSIREIFIPPAQLRVVYSIITFDAFAYGLGISILFGMLIKTYGLTAASIGTLLSIIGFSKLVSQFPVGRFIDKYGSWTSMLVSKVVSAIALGGWLIFTDFRAFAVLSLLYGFATTAWFPAQQTFLANYTTPKERGVAMGRITTFRGMVGFPAPIIGGLLYDHFGFWAPISANLIGALTSLVLIAAFIREPTSRSNRRSRSNKALALYIL
jgi:MFS family permease